MSGPLLFYFNETIVVIQHHLIFYMCLSLEDHISSNSRYMLNIKQPVPMPVK